MLFNKKNDYENEVKYLEKSIDEYSDKLFEIICKHTTDDDDNEWGFLIYSLLYETSDFACWNAKFKGKGTFKSQERGFVQAYGEETGNGQHYVEMKRQYNHAFGFGTKVSLDHVNEMLLPDGGFKNTLVRGALVFTGYLYNYDLERARQYSQFSYSMLTNSVYEIIYQFYDEMLTFLTR